MYRRCLLKERRSTNVQEGKRIEPAVPRKEGSHTDEGTAKEANREMGVASGI